MLLIPGPVDVPEVVLRESAYVQNHRSEEFRSIVRSCQNRLNEIADASHSVITTGSGTTAVESMIYSMTSPGEKVIAVSFREFGDRLVDSLKRRGTDTTVIKKSTRESLKKGEITDILGRHKGVSTICLIHNETGNGTAIRNLKELVEEANSHGLKVLVDSVSGLGALEIKANSWGIDAIATCSQKGLASVPGLGIVSLSERGRKLVKASHDIPVYLDLDVSLKFLAKNETPYTPSTGSFRALNAALNILEKEGIETRWKRHHASASFVRKIMTEFGQQLYGNEENFSDTVVAFKPTVPVATVVKELAFRDIIVSKGMGHLADEMIRVGLLGIVDNTKIARFLNAFSEIAGFDRTFEPEDLPAETSMYKGLLEAVNQ
jgi:aspartate aminotransferase-like enzyme